MRAVPVLTKYHQPGYNIFLSGDPDTTRNDSKTPHEILPKFDCNDIY